LTFTAPYISCTITLKINLNMATGAAYRCLLSELALVVQAIGKGAGSPEDHAAVGISIG
jgi:hypothetical protein